MEATRLLILLVLISSCLSSTWVQGRVHHNHHHHHHKQANQSIALPPNADSPTEPPEPYTPGSDENSTALPPAPPPQRNNSGSYANSTSVPTAPPPSGPYTNSTNSTSIPSAPAPAPINAGSNRNTKNSTSPPPTSTPTPAPPPSPTSVPTAPPPSGSNTNSTNSTTIPIAPAPAPITGGSNGNSTNSTSLPLAPAHPPAPTDAASNWNGSNSTAVFNVRSYGAVGNGVADDTEAFKSAWDSACQDGRGVLLAPQGYTFMIRSTIFAGPCQNAVVFQLDGVLVAPDGPDSWPENNSKRQWLVFYRTDGMTLQGGGIIDGRGEKWWNLPCKPHRGINGTTSPGPCDSPVALRFFMSSNLTVHGLKIRNSPQFHFRFDNCRNVTINSITINSPALSPNTDGIHVENSNTVGIYNSVISNGDDCISIGSGSFNVDIKNITCGPSHGISIGSLGKQNSRACVTNITVTNTIIKHSDNGVRIKTWQGGSGAVSSISFANIHMDTVRNPIIIDQYYCLSKGCTNQTSAVYISDVSYKNIKGTYDLRSPPIHFGCSDSVPCTNITMTEVELLPAQGDIILDPFCWNVYGASQTLTIPPISCLLEGLPRSIMEVDAERCY